MAKNYRNFPWIDWLLRKHPNYANIKNRLAIEDAVANKGTKERLFEKLWPLIFFVGFALFMLLPR
ncbi:MAG: hypothetical protein ACREBB_06640 [Nitrosotalea sp.]